MRKILYCSIIAFLPATLLFSFFKPRLMDVFEFHQVEAGYSAFIGMFVLDVILCFFITRTIGNFLEAFFTSQSRTIIINRLVYVLSTLFGFAIDLVLRFAYSVPNWVKLHGDSGGTFLLLSMTVALFIALSISIFFGFFLDDNDHWFERWFANEDKVPESNAPTVTEVVPSTESLHNLQLIQSRLQKAKEIYESVQTKEAKEQAQIIINEMNEAINHFTENVTAQNDQKLLAEMEKQKRMNNTLIQDTKTTLTP